MDIVFVDSKLCWYCIGVGNQFLYFRSEIWGTEELRRSLPDINTAKGASTDRVNRKAMKNSKRLNFGPK